VEASFYQSWVKKNIVYKYTMNSALLNAQNRVSGPAPPATITATSSYGSVPIDPNVCLNSQSVAGFNITISGLSGVGAGVPVSVLTGATFAGATLCSVSANINITDVVSSNQGTSPYQNVVYNTNGVKTFYTNLNNVFYWCVVNSPTFGGASYNPNYTTAIVSTAGISPAYFTNSCQT
jgi:hypothetical protein